MRSESPHLPKWEADVPFIQPSHLVSKMMSVGLFHFFGYETYSSEYIFSQWRVADLPTIDTISFAEYIMIRNWNGLHCVQPTPF